MSLHLAVDAGPAENLHRGRGIGRVMRELLEALQTRAAGDASLYLSILVSRRHTVAPGAGQVHVRSAWSLLGGVSPWVPYPVAQRWRRLDARHWLASEIQATGASVFLTIDPDAVPIVSGVATVALLHDFIPMLQGGHRGAREAMLRQCDAWRRCAVLLANSEATRADAIQVLGVPPERVRVVHLAAHPRFQPLSDARARVADRWQQQRPFALYVGGFDAHKNVAALLAAFENGDVPSDLDLLVVGSLIGPGERLRRRHPSSRIRWLGPVTDEDLVALYGAATALVQPSRIEGFGLTALEAIQCGTPVIAAPLGALPEVCGEAAQWIDAPTPRAIADALRQLLGSEDLRRDLSAAGLQRAAQFTWARSAAAVVEACDAAAAGMP